MNRTRKLLLGLMAGGGMLTAAGAGTFAAFSASTTNASSTFATGTLVLSNQVEALSACLSTGTNTNTNTNANAGCSTLFDVDVQKPGDTETVDLTLVNEGSIDASELRTFANAACSPGDAVGQDFRGTGDPCAEISVYVQEFSDEARTDEVDCHFGGGDGTTCAHDAAKTLASFSTAHDDADGALTLGAHAGDAPRYFTIGLELDPTAGNDVQGRTATFGFTWQLAQ